MVAGVLLLVSLLSTGTADREDSSMAKADSLHNLSVEMQANDQYELAKVYLTKEAWLRDELADTLGLVQSLSMLGWVLNITEQYDSALTTTEGAMTLALSKVSEDDTLVASLHNVLGHIYSSLNRYVPAIDQLKQSLEIRMKALGSDHPKVADARYNLGYAELRFGNYERALSEFPKAAQIYLTSDTLKAAICFRNLAILQSGLGHIELMDYAAQRSIELAGTYTGENSPDLGQIYGLLGVTYSSLGFKEKALEYRMKAFAIARANQDESPGFLAVSYFELASSYLDLGEIGKADTLAQSALEWFIKTHGEDNPRICDYYILLGQIRLIEDEIEEGLKLITTGVMKWRQLPPGAYPEMLASNLDKLATAYRKVGEYEQAVVYYDEALDAWEQSPPGSEIGRAITMDGLGMAYLESGNAEKGLGYFRSSIEQIELMPIVPPLTLAETYSHLSAAEHKLGYDSLALEHARISVEKFEQSRLQVGSEFHRTYTDRHRQIYEGYFNLLVEADSFERAFEVIERAKLKQLKESLTAGHLALGEEEFKEKIAASQQLALKEEFLSKQLQEEQLKDTSEQVPEKIEHLSELLAETKAEFFQVASEIKTDPDYAFTVTVDPVLFGSLRQDLPRGQKLLMAYPGEKELYLFLVSEEGYEARSVSVSRDSLANLVSECRWRCLERGIWLLRRNKLAGWSWDDDQDSAFYVDEVLPLKSALIALYDIIIKPLECSLADAEVVTFIPSAQLYYVPFGSLAYEQEGELNFLSEKIRQWNVLTSAELLKCIQRRSATPGNRPDTLLLVGNPSGANLPEAQIETEAIEAAYPGSRLLVGEKATENAVLEASGNTEVLHLATHCWLNNSYPWESYIQLAEDEVSDGRWTATEISGQEWRRMGLVTLSACETAVGTERPGLEWESMAKAFSLAMEGPPSIVATLWPVYDSSTKEFMVVFYDVLKKHNKAYALSEAQISLMESEKYAHPFFWAPFMLIGEWR
ncbi:CHAT domain-containing protein [candidate division WOR-3 bacterium]|uniref:CHAT domain-containing protein n=1 Tax=candidate division WOR-3 bacterium TaxID=2052148 RepID=A0A9D5K8D6_UNCW3|nr:CHAT domain-containing protein [candidate division WOR-3 bacterium]MBD3364207.1 CHAT domain-containing protein [candidate division WOR-3 bacterium]